jgi:hypothetical protein
VPARLPERAFKNAGALHASVRSTTSCQWRLIITGIGRVALQFLRLQQFGRVNRSKVRFVA